MMIVQEYKKISRIFCIVFLSAAPLSLGLVLFFMTLETYLVFEKPLTHADAIVVMAGSSRERLPAAVLLFEHGRASRIILANDGVSSAWSETFQRNLFQIEWAERKLIKAGVPDHAIIKLPYTASGTYFDAKHTLEYVLRSDIRSLLIVTSDYHTRRTFWLFNKLADGTDIELGTFPTYSSKLIGGKYFYSIRRTRQLIVEFVKLVYYRFKYGDWI